MDRDVLIVTACLEAVLLATKLILRRYRNGATAKLDGRVAVRWDLSPYESERSKFGRKRLNQKRSGALSEKKERT